MAKVRTLDLTAKNKTLIVPEKAHAKFSASSAKRWLHCPASIALGEQAPPQPESAYAEEGTRAHAAMEWLLNHPKANKEEIKKLHDEYGLEMMSHVYKYTDLIDTLMRDKYQGAELLVEAKISLEHISPDMFGTVDTAIVNLWDTLHVFDFKYGAGIPVEAVDNEQMAFYALGIAHKYDYCFEQIVMTIVQPRAYHEGGTIRSWTLPMGEFQKHWTKTFSEGVTLAKMKNAHAASGDWCRFCNAKIMCPEFRRNKISACADVFKDVNNDFDSKAVAVVPEKLPDPKDLPAEKIAKALEWSHLIESWIGDVRSYAESFMIRGGKLPGFKLVRKRTHRRWADEVIVERMARKLFGDKAFTVPKLKSPAQLDELKAGFSNNYIAQEKPSLTIAPRSDKREEYSAAKEAFKDLELDSAPKSLACKKAPKVKKHKALQKQVKNIRTLRRNIFA